MPSTDGSGLGTLFPILPNHGKGNPVFMPHKYISRALWHHAGDNLHQALLKFYRQPSGAQRLPGYTTIKGFQEGSFDGSKYGRAGK